MSLHWAAAAGDVQEVERLLSKGAAVDAVDESGNSALHYAASAGQSDMVRLLLAAGAAPDLRGTGHWLPLHHTCVFGHSGVVELLLAAAPSTTVGDHHFMSAFEFTAILLEARLTAAAASQHTSDRNRRQCSILNLFLPSVPPLVSVPLHTRIHSAAGIRAEAASVLPLYVTLATAWPLTTTQWQKVRTCSEFPPPVPALAQPFPLCLPAPKLKLPCWCTTCPPPTVPACAPPLWRCTACSAARRFRSLQTLPTASWPSLMDECFAST